MHIILLTAWFFEHAIELANALSKIDDVNITLIMPETTRKYLGSSWDKILNPNINLRLFSYGSVRSAKNILMASFTIYSLIRYINKMKPDVIHIQESGNIFLIFVLPFIKGYPIVSTQHDVRPHLGFEKGFKSSLREISRKIVTRYSNNIIVHGEYLKTVAVSYLRIKSDNIHVIPLGQYEVALFKKYEKKGLREDGNLILFFGRIYEYKGLEYLIKTESLITKKVPDAKIIIAGEGENFKKYEKVMINKDNFVVHNYRVPYKEGAELFQRCSIVVLPYIDASQSAVIPLAYAFKKPVVVTDVGAISEIVDDGVTGSIVPPKNSEALAETIVKLLRDDKLRKEMGENAYKKLKTDLSWANIAEKTIKVYERALVSSLAQQNAGEVNIFMK